MGTEPADPGAPEGPGRGDAPRPVQPPVFDGGDEAPTESLVAGTMGDRCVNCGAALTADQRYCVNCGERRGAPRFTLPTAAAAAGSSEPSESPASKRMRPRRPRAASGATLVAGVGTLLLALGVGVLIGHGAGGGTKTVQAGHAQVITVNENGGGGGASTGGASNASNSSAGSSASKKSGGGSAKHKSGGAKHKSGGHKSKTSAPPAPKPTKKEAQAAQSAANKVTGGGNVNNAPATVTVGGSCTGAGCDPKTHKFNGNFFGQ